MAIGTALAGFLLAVVFYGLRLLNPAEVRSAVPADLQVPAVTSGTSTSCTTFLFVQPLLFVSRRVAEFDKQVIDRFIDNLAVWVRMIARLDDLIDRYLVDGLVNCGLELDLRHRPVVPRRRKPASLRQYVMFIVIGTVALFVLITFYLSTTLAGL